jgi:hypothetical protein
MARLNLKKWKNQETLNARDYVYEREKIIDDIELVKAYELDDLADVVIGLEPEEISGGDVLRYDDGTETWRRSNQLTTHVADTSNPHAVTKTQVGLGNVDNTSDLNKPISTATQDALDTKEPANANIQAHITNTNNPHVVTKTQVGLGNADNTSDLDKPVSTAQQTALNLKVDTSLLGVNNGVATLDEQGKILVAQLPNSVFDSLYFFGVITTNTNLNTLADAAINHATTRSPIGYYWVVTATSAVISADSAVQFGTNFYTQSAFVPAEEGSSISVASHTLEVGDWIVITGLSNEGTSASPYAVSFAVVNNTYELASSSVDGIVRLSNTTTISSSTTGNQVVTQGVLGGLIGTAANTIAAGVHTHVKSDITDFTHTHPISDVVNLQTELDTVGQVANNNTKLGFEALNSVTTGSSNTANGYQALRLNTTGINNTAVGSKALEKNTSILNTAVGSNSLRDNTSGLSNSSIGASALQANTTGGSNNAFGASSLRGNTAGSSNNAIGNDSGRFIANGSTANSTGTNSIFIGESTKALDNGQTNQIVIGHDATGLGSNTVVLGNDSITTTALKGNTNISGNLTVNGSSNIGQVAGVNTKLGFEALNNVTAGDRFSTAVGYFALRNNTTGLNNTAYGVSGLRETTTGSSNTAIGRDAIGENTTGSNNTASGYQAGRYIANGSTANQTSSNSVFIGSDTKALANGQTNQIVIGFNATGKGSNTVQLGNSSVTAGYIGDEKIATQTDLDNKFDQLVFSIYEPIAALNGLTLNEVFDNSNLLKGNSFVTLSGGINITYNNLQLNFDSSTTSFNVVGYSVNYFTLSGNDFYIRFNVDNAPTGAQIQYSFGNGTKYTVQGSYTTPFVFSSLRPNWTRSNRLSFEFWSNNVIGSNQFSQMYILDLTTLGLTSLTQEQLDLYFDLYTKLRPTEVAENTTHTQTESIKTVPVGTLESTVDNFEADGLTLVNSVVNGDFSNGTTDWTAVSTPTVSVSNNILTLSNPDGTANRRIQQSFSTAIGDVWFYYLKAKLNSGDGDLISFFDGAGYSTTNLTSSYSDVFGKTVGATSTTIFFQIGVNANVGEISVDGNAGVFAINMTALGIASYTEAQMLDLVRSGYFDGIANVEKPSVTAVGKNLFDINKPITDYTRTITNTTGTITIDLNANSITTTTNNVTSGWGILYELEPNTQYFINASVSGDAQLRAVNADFTAFLDNGAGLITTNSTGLTNIYFRHPTVGTATFTNIQLELGSTATTYEPYKSSTLTIDTELRSLPNGVRDRVYEQNGEVWLEKRVEERVLQAGDIDSVSPVGSVVQARVLNGVVINGTYNTIDGKTILDGYIETATRNTTAPYDKYIHSETAFGIFNALYVTFPSGTTLAQAQADLAGTVVQYQLATPQLINLTQEGKVDGELAVYENGTIYNTSDTFHADISFDVASNRSAQITGLLESASYQAKQIDTKANKVQEDWIEPTLLNGWVNLGGDFATAGYMKDEFGFVHIKGVIKDGTATADIQLFLLPNGYRPSQNLFLPIISNNTIGAVLIGVGGEVLLRSGNNSFVDLSSISFRVEE